jgi:osmotically-inducible protein OsmY
MLGTFRTLGLASAAALLAFSWSCSSTTPARTQMSDAAITAKVKAKMAADDDVSAMNIDVDTQEGVVYLTGRVHSAKEKRAAEDLAEDVDGVRDVKNMLEVGDIQN